MPDNASAFRQPRSAMLHVTVEVVAWVTRFVGGDGTRRRLFAEAVAPGTTVRSLLSQLSDRYPALRDALWVGAARELSEHIEILVNDAVLGLTHTLDSSLQDGDRITLIGQYTGGSVYGSRCLFRPRGACSRKARLFGGHLAQNPPTTIPTVRM